MIKRKAPVVIDVGTGYTKAGLADKRSPEIVFPSTIGSPKYASSMSRRGSHLKDVYVGEDATNMRGVLRLEWPVKRGIVENWETWETLIRHTFQERLSLDPSTHPVLLAEATFAPNKNREKKAEILFETFDVPSLYVENEASLVLQAANIANGLVIDSGEGITQIVPLQHGLALQRAMTNFRIAGQDINRYLNRLLGGQGIYLDSSAGQEIVRDIKHKLSYLAVDFEKELEKTKKFPSEFEKEYVLPDGQTITLSEERFRAPEIFYKPHLISSERTPLSQAAFDVILDCDIDLRPQLYKNIIISGGTSLLSNFSERLRKEVTALAPDEMKARINVHEVPNREYGVWIGGATLASKDLFQQRTITQATWRKEGVNALYRQP